MIDYDVLNPLLTAQSAITALVGTRIYPVELEQGCALPAMTYKVIGMREQPTFQTSGCNRYRVEFEVYAQTYLSASAVRKAIVSSLNGFNGTVGAAVVQNMDVLQPRDYFDRESLQFRLAIEFYLYSNS